MSRAALGIAAALLTLGVGCGDVSDPRNRIVTYGIATLACAEGDCGAWNDTLRVTAADRGDTVWVLSGVEGGTPGVGDSALVTLRADCALNVAVLDATTSARTLPAVVTCPDSVVEQFVSRPPNVTEYRYFQWVVDSGIPPGSYTLEGRMLVSPDLHPVVSFEVR